MKKEYYLYIGTYAQPLETGIAIYTFNIETGESSLLNEVSGIDNPSYLTISKDGKYLYAVNEVHIPEAKIMAYTIDKQTGYLQWLDEEQTGGSSPCYIWIDSQRRLAVTANYSGGSISVCPLTADGKIQSAKVYSYKGGTKDSIRQNAPHLHCVFASPDERFLYANDLGTDRIYKYEVISGDSGTLRLKEGVPAFYTLPTGEGPRHAIFHPNGRYVYLIGELSGQVTVFSYNEGDLAPIQQIQADPLQASGSADIKITPDGSFLYVSNRLKGDGLTILSVNPDTGKLTTIGHQPTGIHPRNILITPNGQLILVANTHGNTVEVYHIDKEAGMLIKLDKDISINKPACLQLL